MKIYTSYFYMVRFMRPYEIPCSTAVWDPKWFHDFQGAAHVFMDKRGVLNGIRATMFAPGETCQTLCHGRDKCLTDPKDCLFLRKYSEQLDTLDFNSFMQHMEETSLIFQQQLKLDRPADFVLLLHEAPDNPCSERVPIHNWFHKHGYQITEWKREGDGDF